MPDLQDEAALAAGLRNGDADAWRSLYDQYSLRVWQFAARLVGSDSHAVADVVQETFLAAAASVLQFDRERGSLWNWLAGIAHHQIAQHWRRVRMRRIDPTEPRFDDSPAAVSGPESRVDQFEAVSRIRTILSELPADYAALLVAKYAEERSVSEILELFGGTHEGIRSRLARARAEFKRRMEASAPHDPDFPITERKRGPLDEPSSAR